MSGYARVLTAAAIACFVVSLALCEVIRRQAIHRALLDAVNERSLHTAPTPRLGGVAIVVTTLLASMATWQLASRELRVLVVLCGGIALVGLRDDLRPVSALTRFALQFAAAIAFVWIAGVPPLLVARGIALPVPSLVTGAILVVWIVGVLNIYNFMDGMDGLAGFQTVAASAALAALLGGGSPSLFALALGASASGFLAHNFPPARIFMGDAGSTFIGMAFAALAVLGMHHDKPLTESALPLAPFLLDGTFTIFRRALRREKVWQAHRTHLYQRAVQTGLAHREVLLVYMAWIGVSCTGALLASSAAGAIALAWGASVLGLALVWRWVVRRESERANAP